MAFVPFVPDRGKETFLIRYHFIKGKPKGDRFLCRNDWAGNQKTQYTGYPQKSQFHLFYRSKQTIVNFSNNFASLIKNRLKTTPVIAINKEPGKVVITQHCCKYFTEALVEEVVKTHKKEKACILTQTNEEAMQVFGLLEKKGIRTKLIQSLGQLFGLNNLAEIKYFLSIIRAHFN